ncbi:hypothetical protein FOCC_FOCC012636 [Frankliniella occidentalis]|nr:hypothetical protein FOCC_FOCC012636 [Frankliniella occidentalis]
MFPEPQFKLMERLQIGRKFGAYMTQSKQGLHESWGFSSPSVQGNNFPADRPQVTGKYAMHFKGSYRRLLLGAKISASKSANERPMELECVRILNAREINKRIREAGLQKQQEKEERRHRSVNSFVNIGDYYLNHRVPNPASLSKFTTATVSYIVGFVSKRLSAQCNFLCEGALVSSHGMADLGDFLDFIACKTVNNGLIVLTKDVLVICGITEAHIREKNGTQRVLLDFEHAKRHSTPVPEHECFKNYNGPAPQMEQVGVVEGFNASMDRHGVVYKYYIGDGDAGVMSGIQEEVWYGGHVQKVQCANHVTRNVCEKVRALCKNTSVAPDQRKGHQEGKEVCSGEQLGRGSPSSPIQGVEADANPREKPRRTSAEAAHIPIVQSLQSPDRDDRQEDHNWQLLAAPRAPPPPIRRNYLRADPGVFRFVQKCLKHLAISGMLRIVSSLKSGLWFASGWVKTKSIISQRPGTRGWANTKHFPRHIPDGEVPAGAEDLGGSWYLCGTQDWYVNFIAHVSTFCYSDCCLRRRKATNQNGVGDVEGAVVPNSGRDPKDAVLVPIVPMKSVCLKGQVPSKDKVTDGHVPDESSTEGENSNEESKSDKSITGSSQSPGDTASGSECNSLLAKDLAEFKCEVCGQICKRRHGFDMHMKSHEGKEEKVMQAASTSNGKKINLKRAAEEAVDDVVPKKTKEEKTIIVPKRQYLRCLSINQSELKPLDDFSSDSEEDIEVEEYDEPEYEKSCLPRQQTIANTSRLLGIVKFNAEETEQDSDLFESSLNIDYFEAGILKMEKAGAMPSTIIKNVADYRYVPAAYEIRFDDPGVPSGELFTKKINRLKNTLDTITSKYEKKNVVLIEEHKKKLAKEAERVDMGAVLSFGSDKEVTDIINKTLDDLENCENLNTARHYGRRDVLKKVHQVSCYIASCLIVSGTRPSGLQRFSNNNFEKAEYDIATKMYHFRLTEQKTSGVGGAAPLSANEQLMSVMKTYYEIKVQVFPNSKKFLLNNQGNPLTYIQVFQSINKYLKNKNLPTITTSVLRVAYETTSQNALQDVPNVSGYHLLTMAPRKYPKPPKTPIPYVPYVDLRSKFVVWAHPTEGQKDPRLSTNLTLAEH